MLPLRKVLLAVALAATVGLSLFDLPGAVPEPAESVSAKPPVPSPVVVTRQPVVLQSAQPLRTRFDPTAPDLFAPRNWQPPPARSSPAVVTRPQAPPLPFRYLGKVLDSGEIMVFVDQGARTHLLRKGDVLADYKVEQITPAEMTLVYLPLNEKQRLTFGSAN